MVCHRFQFVRKFESSGVLGVDCDDNEVGQQARERLGEGRDAGDFTGKQMSEKVLT